MRLDDRFSYIDVLNQLLSNFFPHSVAFAYVADVTDESSRSLGYGLVTAGFAASLIISPALGAGIELLTGEITILILIKLIIAAFRRLV